MVIKFQAGLNNIESGRLKGFFVGWPNPPSSEAFLRILKGSYRIVLALDGDKVVGFINAISDGVLTSYIPLLEVLPDYQGRGIGKELIVRMKNELKDLYMTDLCCDDDLVKLYEKFDMVKTNGMCLRNYDKQNGLPPA